MEQIALSFEECHNAGEFKKILKHISFKMFITNILESGIYITYLSVVPSINDYLNYFFFIINTIILIVKTCEAH